MSGYMQHMCSGSVLNYALIVAAGRGSRTGSDIPKQYIEIAGKSILRRTIEQFLAVIDPGCIRVVIAPEHEKMYQKCISGLNIGPVAHGGGERFESVYNGLRAIPDIKPQDRILIHDAARPFVSPDDIRGVIHALDQNPAVTLAVPVRETLHYRSGKNEASVPMDRDACNIVQTPQGFRYEVIMQAHEHYRQNIDPSGPSGKPVDDTGLVLALGYDIAYIHTESNNFKVTTAYDLEKARLMLENRPAITTRTASGFDVHAFDTSAHASENACVRLCGIDIPNGQQLTGHSDADVGLHALTDALFGCLADGDIGMHFPPSDPRYKDMDSALFVQKALDLCHARQAVISFIDLTLICETPKIGPYRNKMRARIAELTGLPVERISIKATTTERLGFTGRGEGIAAQAIVTVEMESVS